MKMFIKKYAANMAAESDKAKASIAAAAAAAEKALCANIYVKEAL